MAYTVLEESKYLMIESVKHLIVSFVPQSRVGIVYKVFLLNDFHQEIGNNDVRDNVFLKPCLR